MKMRKLLSILSGLAVILMNGTAVSAETKISSVTGSVSPDPSTIAVQGGDPDVPVFTLNDSAADTDPGKSDTGWFALFSDNTWQKMNSGKFGTGTFRYQVCVYYPDTSYVFEDFAVLTIDGEDWQMVTNGISGSRPWAIFCSPEYKIPGTKVKSPGPIQKGDDYMISWTPVSHCAGYEITARNIRQGITERSKTFTVSAYDTSYNMSSVFKELTVRTGDNPFVISITALGDSGYLDSDPAMSPDTLATAWSWNVKKRIKPVIDYTAGKITWDAYNYPETKVYYYHVADIEDNYVIDGYFDASKTELPFETYAETYGWETGRYVVHVCAMDETKANGGWELTDYKSDKVIYEYTKKIKTITFEGIVMPMEGNRAEAHQDDISVKEDILSVPPVSEGSTVYWRRYAPGPDSWIVMSDTEKFEASGKYLISIPVFCNDDNYTFSATPNVTVNGMPVSADVYIVNPEGTAARIDCELPVSVKSDSVYVVKAGALNVRSLPGLEGERIGGLSYGDVVEAKGQNGGWTMFDFNGQTGWVMTDYLALTYSRDTAFADGPVYYTVEAGAVRVREDISTSAYSPGEMHNGKEVLATGMRSNDEGNWLVIDYEADGVHYLGYMLFSYENSSGNMVYLFNGKETPPLNEPAEEDTESPELHIDGGSYPHISFAPYKASVAAYDHVSLSEENYEAAGDGYLLTTVYPDDAMNFRNLTPDKVILEAGLEDLEITDFVLNEDGSVTLRFGRTNAYTVTGENGTASASPAYGPAGTVVTLTAEPAEGYVFKEWQVVSGDVTVEGDTFVIGDGKAEIKAIFEPIVPVTYYVTFQTNGGSEVAVQTVNENTAAAQPEDPVYEGYVFGGWFSDETCMTAYDFSTPVTADITLYAKWTKEEKEPVYHNISFDLNGGTLDGKTGTVILNIEEGTSITLPKPVRSGYEFDYWEGSRYEAGASYKVEGDHTFKAQWKEIPKNTVPTGDHSGIVQYGMIFFGSLIVIAGVLFRKKNA